MDILLKTFSFSISIFVLGNLFAQEPVIKINFDDEIKTESDLNIKSLVRGKPVFSEGLKGKAYDLSKNSASRFPLETTGDLKFLNEEFSVIVWVKKNPVSNGDNLIAGTLNPAQKGSGWVIAEQKNGAWTFILSDSVHVFDYEPMESRQSISDGKWHMLGVTFSRSKMECRFYYDGVNVGIYNLMGLNEIKIPKALFIGGYKVEMHAFTGYLDEVSVFDTEVDAGFMAGEYKKYFELEDPEEYKDGEEIKIMTWNIWHGGREHGEQAGVSRVVDVIKESGADIIGMIETYQSGEIISDSLGYYFYLISSNLSIMSRYPIEETVQIYKPFNSGGAYIRLNQNKKIFFIDLWLHYLPGTRSRLSRSNVSLDSLMTEEKKTRYTEIKAILSDVDDYIQKADEVPVFMVGDYNSGSHLDWIDETREIHNGYVFVWPVSLEMEKAGMMDSYRFKYPDPLKWVGRTWSPVFKTASQDRIDYVYSKGKDLNIVDSRMLDFHPVKWPSDHAAVITTYTIKK